MKRYINRRLQKYKHIVDANFINVNANLAVQSATIAIGTDNPVIAGATNVQARARIRAVYMELTFHESAAINANVQTYDWYIIFNPQAGFALPPGNNVGIQNTKTYVIKQGKIPVPTANSQNPIKVSGLIKIPAKYQRYMNGDVLQFVFSTSQNLGNFDNVQTKWIYKEIRG